mmetsp:Transcript_11321/g.34842  ORF Transcript_11321/g.34842 Transcript_11321/m.34842 type:complete len:99 (-) Transcript_11321:55-351(-)
MDTTPSGTHGGGRSRTWPLPGSCGRGPRTPDDMRPANGLFAGAGAKSSKPPESNGDALMVLRVYAVGRRYGASWCVSRWASSSPAVLAWALRVGLYWT